MKSDIKFRLVILLLLSMIAIFISPAMDLQPTALRALTLANSLFAILALAATILTRLFGRVVPSFAHIVETDCGLLPAPDLVALNCTRLC